MSDKVEKYILNLCEEELSTSMLSIIEELAYSIDTTIDINKVYEFILTDDIKSSMPTTGEVIFLGNLADVSALSDISGVAIVADPELSTVTARTFFSRVLGGHSSLDIGSSTAESLKSLGKVKITDHLNAGFYCDSISIEAAKESFDFFGIKKGIFHLINYVSEVIRDEKGSFPLDIDYGICENQFFLQAHFPVKDISREEIWDGILESKSALSHLYKEVNGLDIFTLSKTEKLVLTAVWNKEVSAQKSLYLHGIESFEGKPFLSEVDVKEIHINYIDENHLELPPANKISSELGALSRVADFLNEQGKKITQINSSNIEDFLHDFPDQILVKGLSLGDKEEVVRLLSDTEGHRELKRSLRKLLEKEDPKETIQKVSSKVSNLSIDEAHKIISSGVEDHTEEVQRVSGWKELVDSSSTVVKGSREDLTEESITIQGEGADAKESWVTVKAGVVSKIDEKVKNNEILSHQDIREKVSTILQSDASMSKGEADTLVEGVLDEMALELKKETSGENENNNKLKEASAKKDAQLSRMMKIIDIMKKELIIAKSSSHHVPENISHEEELKRLHDEILKKNKQIEFIKKNNENLNNSSVRRTNESADHLINQSLTKKEVEGYEEKVKNLEVKLNEARSRSEILNQKLEEERESFLVRMDSDTSLFREKMVKSQKILSSFQKENRKLLLEAEDLKLQNQNLMKTSGESNTALSNVELSEKESLIEELKFEVKKEKDQAKAISLKIKQLEQKNKFLNAQLEEASKKSSGSKSSNQSSVDTKYQYKIKQLEKRNLNFKEEAIKAKKELQDKKKEIHGLKQEVNVLKAEVTEYERKLALNKNKVA